MCLSDELEEPSRSKGIRYDAGAGQREMVDGTGTELAVTYVEACQLKTKKEKGESAAVTADSVDLGVASQTCLYQCAITGYT